MGATACSSKVFVCLSRVLKSRARTKCSWCARPSPLGTDTHCWLFHKINPQSCMLITGTAFPTTQKHLCDQSYKPSVTQKWCWQEKGAVLTRAAWCCSSPHTWLAPWCCSARGICSRTSDTGSHWGGTSGRCHRRQASETSSEPGEHSKWLIQANYLFINWDLDLQSPTEINNRAKMPSEPPGCYWA